NSQIGLVTEMAKMSGTPADGLGAAVLNAVCAAATMRVHSDHTPPALPLGGQERLVETQHEDGPSSEAATPRRRPRKPWPLTLPLPLPSPSPSPSPSPKPSPKTNNQPVILTSMDTIR